MSEQNGIGERREKPRCIQHEIGVQTAAKRVEGDEAAGIVPAVMPDRLIKRAE